MKKKPKKRVPEQIATDSDEHFAYIVGYTEGDAPYGITWEEMEATERSAAAPRSVETMMKVAPVSLTDIVQEMQIISDTMMVYFKSSSGEFITITDEYIHAAESYESLDNRPEWEQDAIRMTADVLAREDDGDYIPLPSR